MKSLCDERNARTIRVGHSPDPDDAFMFYGLARGKVSLENFRIEHVIEDIQSLNRRAIKGDLEVSAISAATYPLVADQYWILSSGASVGRNYGPIVVANETHNEDSLKGKRIAIPGFQTTAFMLLKIFLGDFVPVEMDFTKIISSVQKNEVDAGLIIHEGQIVYDSYGLKECMDLGALWQEKHRLPIPLGLDVVRKDLGIENAREINEALKASVSYAMANENEALDYAIRFGRGIEKESARKFVGMYVNQDTLDLGPQGREALKKLFDSAFSSGIIKNNFSLVDVI